MSDNIRVVAVAFFSTTTNKYFICRRGPAESGAGHWEFPGGKIDPGETEKQALIREIREELSVKVQESELVFISDHLHQYETKKIHIYLYQCNVESLDYRLIDHDMADWAFVENLAQYPLAAADIPFIRKLKGLSL